MPNHDGNFTFHDRSEAGMILANRLRSYATLGDIVVLALPLGGVPVGAEIARALNAPLFPFIVRKLGVPGHQELAMGAITSSGEPIIDPAVTEKLHLSDRLVQSIIRRETQRLSRTHNLYSAGRTPELKDKIVILADDGATTGSTLALAAQTIRQQGAAEVIIAVPVATPVAVALLNKSADEVVCLMEPKRFVNVSHWYQHFELLTDRQICHIMERLVGPEPQPKSA